MQSLERDEEDVIEVYRGLINNVNATGNGHLSSLVLTEELLEAQKIKTFGQLCVHLLRRREAIVIGLRILILSEILVVLFFVTPGMYLEGRTSGDRHNAHALEALWSDEYNVSQSFVLAFPKHETLVCANTC